MNYDTLDNTPTMDGGDHEGKLLASRYRIVRKLGEGGMGMVYLAADTELGDHQVAIKFIPPMLAGNARAVKNLKREALTSIQLSHPNIVRLHDLHTDGHQKFLVMEYISGRTLDDVLGESESECLSLEKVLDIIEQLAAGLDFAHSKQVLHRDLKPSNIMVSDDGTVKLLDFGIAREMKDSYTRVTGNLTSGTLPYMSPEQLMGENPTVSMDVYSLGAVAYECLAGHPPFYMGDIRRQIEVKAPEPIDSLPERVNQVLLRVLDKKSANRPVSAGALVQALKLPDSQSAVPVEPVIEPIPVEKSKPSPPPPPKPKPVVKRPKEVAPAPVSGSTMVSESPPQVSLAHQATWKRLLFAILVSIVAWGMGSLLQRLLIHGLLNQGRNFVIANLFSAGLGAVCYGLGTVFSLRLLGVVRSRQAWWFLPISWGVLWMLVVLVMTSFEAVRYSHWASGGMHGLGAFASALFLLILFKREGIHLTRPHYLLFLVGWLLIDLVIGLLLLGVIGGVLKIVLIYFITRGRQGQDSGAGEALPKPKSVVLAIPEVTNESSAVVSGARHGSVFRSILVNAGLWSLCMVLGSVIMLALENLEWSEIQIVSMVAGFWGFSCGAAMAWSLMLLGALYQRKSLLILSGSWGILWPVIVSAVMTVGNEMNSEAGAFTLLGLGVVTSFALLVFVLRREGLKLSIPRTIVLGLAWLISAFLCGLVWAASTELLFDDLLGMSNDDSIVAGAGLGGFLIGVLSLWFSHLITATVRSSQRAYAAKSTTSNRQIKIAIVVMVTILLVVVGSVAIFARVQHWEEKGIQAECANDMRSLIDAWKLYRTEKGQLPAKLDDLASYVNNQSIFYHSYYHRGADLHSVYNFEQEPNLIIVMDTQYRHNETCFHVAFADGRLETCTDLSDLLYLINLDNEARAQHKMGPKVLWE